MPTYTVKNGENLYDVALKLFGSVEGIFNLLACNQDAINETGLSLEQTLEAGTELEYTESGVISQDVVDQIAADDIPVKNGEQVYDLLLPKDYMISYVKKFNVGVAKESLDIAASSPDWTTEDHLEYLNSNCLWLTNAFISDDIAALEDGDFSKAETITQPDRLNIPKMIVKHQGMESHFVYKMKSGGVMFIDWGDNQPADVHTICNTRRTAEHCYADDGEHTIVIYGNFVFTTLDLTGIGGIYYPLSTINVRGWTKIIDGTTHYVLGEFITPFPNNDTINALIHVTAT